MEKQRWILGLILHIWSETTAKLRFRVLSTSLLALLLCSSVCIASTCPSSTSSLTTISTEEFKFSLMETRTVNVVVGPVSNSLYYLNKVLDNTCWNIYYTTLMKTDAFGSRSWLASFSESPNSKSLAVDTTEQFLYIAVGNSYPRVMIVKSLNWDIQSYQE